MARSKWSTSDVWPPCASTRRKPRGPARSSSVGLRSQGHRSPGVQSAASSRHSAPPGEGLSGVDASSISCMRRLLPLTSTRTVSDVQRQRTPQLAAQLSSIKSGFASHSPMAAQLAQLALLTTLESSAHMGAADDVGTAGGVNTTVPAALISAVISAPSPVSGRACANAACRLNVAFVP